MKRQDKVLIIILMFFSFGMTVCQYVYTQKVMPKNVYIYKDSKLLYCVPLEADQIICVGQEKHSNIIEIKNKQVCMRQADCPDKLCVMTGQIAKSGQQIVCLPHKIIVKISGMNDNDIDGVTR